MKRKILLNIITLGALVILIVLMRHQFSQVYSHLSKLSLIPLALLIPLELSNYWAEAKMCQEYFFVLGDKVRIWELMKASFELNFVNIVFPTGGVSGFSYFALRMKPLGIKTAHSTMVQGARFVLTFITYVPLLFLGMLLLAIVGKANYLTIFIGSSITTLTIVGTIIMIYIVSNRRRVQTVTAFVPKIVNWAVRHFYRNKEHEVISVEKVERVFGELHDDYLEITSDLSQLRKTFFWALMNNVTELAVIYMAFVAEGHWINPGAIIIAYAVANFAGLISTFSGIGLYEFLMTGIMASAGVPAALALSATLVYRVVNIVVFVPVGYYFYRQFLREKNTL
ncbi:MAG TPA: lysylphosphatidylglycerol synthase transmembrane domain-containing protein [Candidatus Saccharimonadales bacterium]|nr:lysylphosphatidylglycerol synthase transmembrane domain-containing protein [Candidatus Saccharimonadales bacterium]